ncbi:ficolin-1 [Zeugodacus cucurbitae]|uniref:Tenascin n=1 Tax=Zeugodacus cucurbitae TaxID=28588 RepID=A0A0A1WI08_ZEUCU|nr:ficolin-1 [Zeugodacus cucurbitae]
MFGQHHYLFAVATLSSFLTSITFAFDELIPKRLTYASLPTSCAEAFWEPGSTARNGINQIKQPLPGGEPKPVYVWCERDPQGGKAWMVVMRRQKGDLDFYRNWGEYKYGFGELNTNFFIGLELLHGFTLQQPSELRIDLTYTNGTTAYVIYDYFAIGSENEKYNLKILGNPFGSARDRLWAHRGMKFSTADQQNDESPNFDCATYYRGAWWYRACYESHLFGRYGSTFEWSAPLAYARMSIRPKD